MTHVDVKDHQVSSVILVFIIFGPIYYFVLLEILGFIWKDYSPISQSMSEIGAVDSPYRHWMNFAGFTFIGLCIIIYSYVYYIEFHSSLQGKIGTLCIIISGTAMFLVGFFPCDAMCVDVSNTGKLHSLTSTIAAIFLPLSAMVSGNVMYQDNNWDSKWGYLSFWLGFSSMMTGPIVGLNLLSSYIGLIQRIGIGLSLFWISVVSWKIYNENKNSK